MTVRMNHICTPLESTIGSRQGVFGAKHRDVQCTQTPLTHKREDEMNMMGNRGLQMHASHRYRAVKVCANNSHIVGVLHEFVRFNEYRNENDVQNG
jgi:hypothetical protein